MWAGESAFMVSLAVVAFRGGGVAAVGAVTAARMAAAALLAPFLATMADRVRRERVLACVGVVRAAMLGCAAVVTAAGGPPGATYGFAVVATVAVALYRPAHSALLPALAKSPQDLTSANAVRGMLDSVATLAGPVVAAVLLAASGPPRSSPRAPLRRCWPVWSSSRSRITRRRERMPPAGAAARCSRASPPSRPIAGCR
jgi:MFS-type transporter involved in bile tolerance (Atg22 family)